MAVIKDKKCMIIGAAPLASGAVFEEFDPKEHYVICADAGYDTAVQYGAFAPTLSSAILTPPQSARRRRFAPLSSPLKRTLPI